VNTLRLLWALLKKESAAVAPHWFVTLALVASSSLLSAIGTDLVLEPLSARFDGWEVSTFLAFMVAFAVGHTLVAPEFAEGQIEFLDSLPTSRVVLFAMKALAALFPCLLIVVGSLTTDVLFAWLVPGPPGADVWRTVWVGNAILLTGALGGLGLGMLLSWLRGLAWGVLILGFVVGMVTGVLFPTVQAYVPLFGTWGTLEFIDGQPTHALAPLVVWSTIGVFGIFTSFLLFIGPGAGLTRQGSWMTGGIRIGVMGCLSLLILALGALSLLGLLIRAPELLGEGIAVHETENLRVLYRPADEAHVLATVADLEQLSRDVGTAIGNNQPLQIDIEFLGAAQNHGGVFTGGKIRLRRDADRNTLAHEMAHAHAFALQGPAAWHQRSHVRFFEEGLASWVAAGLTDQPAVPGVAGVIHAKDPVALDLLVEDDRFSTERDLAQAYPLGQAFVEALDRVGGVEARACVLREVGAIGSERIAGLALWVTLSERCGFALDTVVVEMERLLDAAAAQYPPAPDLEAAVVGEELVVEQVWPAGATQIPLDVVCRFRDTPDADVAHYEHVYVREGTCAIPTWRLSGTTFEYQVGFVLGPDETVYDRWVAAPLP
jgi:hypothetical protein